MAEQVQPSIRLSEVEWRTTLQQVQSEGKSEYQEWMPSFLAAIEMGYFDEHLQLFARHMRQRYNHLVDPSKPGPAYVPTDIDVPVFDREALVYGRDTLLAPWRRGVDPNYIPERFEFKAFGNTYKKSDFVGSYVLIHFPARGVGTGNIWQVTKTLRGAAFQAQLVHLGGVERPNNKLGMEQRFRFEFHQHLFEI